MIKDEVWVTLYCCSEIAVSDLGNLKRLTRTTKDGRLFQEIDIPICYKQRYARFAYTHNGDRKFMSVHRAVFFSFNQVSIPKDRHRIIVDHVDNNTHNNRADNLQLITQSENVIKANKNKQI